MRSYQPWAAAWVLILTAGAVSARAQSANQEETDGKAGRDFAGINFGIGVSLTGDVGGDDRVKTAVVENGIVRVTEDDNSSTRMMLESHYFFQPFRPIPECSGAGLAGRRARRNSKECVEARADLQEVYDTETRQNWGFGPFVALQPGTSELIEAIGGGVMVGFKRAGGSNSSFNLGIGAVIDMGVQLLGDGFAANEPAPLDAEGDPFSIRYRKTDQWGWLALVSFSFE